MTDTSGQADIRGIDVTRLVRGFQEEALVLRKFVGKGTTNSREIRWYSQTAGYITGPTTTGITTSRIANAPDGSQPVVAEQDWTRNTSYVRKYFVESPLISEEDIKDCDVDILGINFRKLTQAVENQIEQRIYSQLTTGTGVQTGAATADGWDDTATGNPILDLLTAEQAIRAYRYPVTRLVCYINSIEYKNLINFIISVKGSSIPTFASDLVKNGVLMGLLNFDIVVSENATTDQALVFVPQTCGIWKSFMPLTSAVITEPGIGRKIRIWEEGEFLLTDPKACYLITDTVK